MSAWQRAWQPVCCSCRYTPLPTNALRWKRCGASGAEVIPISGVSGTGVDWVLDKLLEAIPSADSPVDDDGEEDAVEWSPL